MNKENGRNLGVLAKIGVGATLLTGAVVFSACGSSGEDEPLFNEVVSSKLAQLTSWQELLRYGASLPGHNFVKNQTIIVSIGNNSDDEKQIDSQSILFQVREEGLGEKKPEDVITEYVSEFCDLIKNVADLPTDAIYASPEIYGGDKIISDLPNDCETK